MNKETGMPQQVVYQNYPVQDDEIDISELFDKVWRRRLFIVASVFIAVVIASGLFAISLFANAPETRFSTIIQFSFPNAEKGQYPGGQKFSYNDLVSAKILEQVYSQNALSEKGIAFNDFINAISINPFAENAEFIKKKYQSLLGDKKLTRPEIEALEATYLNELNASQSRFVRLSFLESGLKGVDPLLVQKILQDIPKVWSQYAIEELGVLDLKVVGADFYQPQMIARFEYLQILEYMQNSSKVLVNALNELIEDEIGGLIRDPKTGITAYDLQIRLDNLIDFEIEPLFSTVTNLGITKSSEKAMIYLGNTIQNLEDQQKVLTNKAENFARIINQYTGFDTTKLVNKQDGAAGGFAQYDSTFLDKFTALIEEKSDRAYTQNMLRERLTALQEIEEIEGQIIKFKRAQERLQKSEESITAEVKEDVIKDIFIARDNFEELVGQYKGLLQIRNQQVLGDTDMLYELTSDDVLVESNLRDRAKKLILVVVLSGMVALMLAVLIALIRRLPERNGSNPAS